MKIYFKNIIFIFLIFNFCTTFNEKELAKKYYPKGKYIELLNFHIFVIEKNLDLIQQNKIPIILIHGFSSNVHTWEYYIENLKYHPVIAFDLPGFGFSSKPETKYNRSSFVNIVKAIMDYYNFYKVILIGNSMGGEISLRFTILHPDKVEKLILIDSAGLMEIKELPWFIQMGQTFLIDYFNFMFRNKIAIQFMLSSAFYDSDKITDKKVNLYYYPLRTDGGINAHKSLLKQKYEKINKEDLKSIKVPTLIIWGQNDHWIRLYDGFLFKEYIPNSVLVIIPECGHVPQEEKPEITLPYINKFININ